MGGASSAMAVEEMLTATYLLGRAITAVAFPGMYRIYDFHSQKAPPLQNVKKFAIFSNEDDSDDEEESDVTLIAPDPCMYDSMFKVHVADDVIYLENPIEANEAGWTPLHTCCMSTLTVTAGVSLIDETIRQRGNLNIKTIKGPGNFNSGWTPLHMAAAYGIEPLVAHLVKAGADPNTYDGQGYTPLLEACHRGFASIVALLISARARLDYMPTIPDRDNSPFSRPVPQAALGEAARSGFHTIVQLLVDANAPKNQSNSIGWTALHEACFYNRIEVVKILMVNGADASQRTRNGALPYHFAGLQMIRKMLQEMGEAEVVPDDDDVIDMALVMKELTLTGVREGGELPQQKKAIEHGDGQAMRTPKKIEPHKAVTPAVAPGKSPTVLSSSHVDDDDDDKEKDSLLHSGRVLGDLPSLASKRSSPGKPFESSGKVSSSSKKNKKKNRRRNDLPKDAPPGYLCELSQRLMSDPVRSTYGNVFERAAIASWIRDQGQICPITGCPLAESELEADKQLKAEIQQWILARGQAPLPVNKPVESDGNFAVDDSPAPSRGAKGAAAARTVPTDDLYDF